MKRDVQDDLMEVFISKCIPLQKKDALKNNSFEESHKNIMYVYLFELYSCC